MGNCQTKSAAHVPFPKGPEYDELNAETKSVDSEENQQLLIQKSSSDEEASRENGDAGKSDLDPLAVPELARTVATKPSDNFGFGLISEMRDAAADSTTTNTTTFENFDTKSKAKDIMLTIVEGQDAIETCQETLPPTSNNSPPGGIERGKGQHQHGPVSVDSPSVEGDRTDYISPSSTVSSTVSSSSSSSGVANKDNFVGVDSEEPDVLVLVSSSNQAPCTNAVAMKEEEENEKNISDGSNEHRITLYDASVAAAPPKKEEIDGSSTDGQITVSAGQEMCSWALDNDDKEQPEGNVGKGTADVAQHVRSGNVNGRGMHDTEEGAPSSVGHSKDDPVKATVMPDDGQRHSAYLDQTESSSGKDEDHHTTQTHNMDVPRRHFTFNNFVKDDDTEDQFVHSTCEPNAKTSASAGNDEALMTPPSNPDKAFGTEMYLSPPTPEYDEEQEGVEILLSPPTDPNSEKKANGEGWQQPQTSIRTPMELVEFTSDSIVPASTNAKINDGRRRRGKSPEAQQEEEQRAALVEFTSNSLVPASDVAARREDVAIEIYDGRTRRCPSPDVQADRKEERPLLETTPVEKLVEYASSSIVPVSGLPPRREDANNDNNGGGRRPSRNPQARREEEKPERVESLPGSIQQPGGVVSTLGPELQSNDVQKVELPLEQVTSLQSTTSMQTAPRDTDESPESTTLKPSQEVDSQVTKEEATVPKGVETGQKFMEKRDNAEAISESGKDKKTSTLTGKEETQEVPSTESASGNEKESVLPPKNANSNPPSASVLSTYSLSRRSKHRRRSRSRSVNRRNMVTSESTKDRDVGSVSVSASSSHSLSPKVKASSSTDSASDERQKESMLPPKSCNSKSVSASSSRSLSPKVKPSSSSSESASDQKQKESVLPPKSYNSKSDPPSSHVTPIYNSLSRRSQNRRRSRSRSINRSGRVIPDSSKDKKSCNAGKEITPANNSEGKAPSSSLTTAGGIESSTENATNNKEGNEYVLPPKSIKSNLSSSQETEVANARTLGRQARGRKSRSRSVTRNNNSVPPKCQDSVEAPESAHVQGPQTGDRLPLSPKAQNTLSTMPNLKTLEDRNETANSVVGIDDDDRQKQEIVPSSRKVGTGTAPVCTRGRTLSERKREKALNAIKSKSHPTIAPKEERNSPTQTKTQSLPAVASKEEHNSPTQTKTPEPNSEALQPPAASAVSVQRGSQRGSQVDMRKRRLDRARRLRATHN